VGKVVKGESSCRGSCKGSYRSSYRYKRGSCKGGRGDIKRGGLKCPI